MRVFVHTYIHTGEGNVDMGITGQDIVQETRLESPEMHVKELMVSWCCVCVMRLTGPLKGGRESHSTRRTANNAQELGFGKCSLSLQAPMKNDITDPKQLSGGRIVTSFPNLTRAFFDKLDAETGKHTSACLRALNERGTDSGVSCLSCRMGMVGQSLTLRLIEHLTVNQRCARCRGRWRRPAGLGWRTRWWTWWRRAPP